MRGSVIEPHISHGDSNVMEGEESGAPPLAIDWTEAINQVDGDLEFLDEVLQDLIDEANTAVDDIEAGIASKEFERIMKAAHRIKGSATYLGCAAMKMSAFKIQQLGHDGISQSDSDNGLLDQIKEEYSVFVFAFKELRKEIERWKEEQHATGA
jgi:HPt (histidine-containing phosphotransfer) domain-containing protein